MEVSRNQFVVNAALSILFILISVFSVDTSSYYLLFELLLSAFFLYLFFMRGGIHRSMPVGFYVIVIIGFLVSCTSFLVSPELLIYNIHYIIYYMLCFSAYAFLRGNNIGIEDVLNHVNQFYIIYLVACLVMWLLEMKVGAYEIGEKHTLDIFNINKSVLLGVDGSPASIDSFSALIFLLNLFFGEARRRVLMLGISFIAIVLALRLTPVVAMTMSIFSYVVIANRISWSATIIVMNLVFVVFLYLSWDIMQNIDSVQNKDYLYLYNATHARFAIWGQQINVMLENYSLSRYILGGFNNELFTVSLYQISGEELTRTTYNPHSSLLLLLFRNPFLFILTYLTYLFLIIKYFDKRKAVIAIFIFFSLMMNSSLLATGSPVFTIVMIMLTFPVNLKKMTELLLQKKEITN